MPKKNIKIASFVVRWGSMALMAFSIYLLASNAFFWIRADSTTGVVVAQEEMEKLRTRTIRESQYQKSAYAPYIKFETEGGEEIFFLSNIGYGEKLAFHTGDEVSVLYLSSEPETAKISSLFEIFVLPIVLFVFGGIFWLVGSLLQYLGEPTDKNKRPARPKG